MAFPVILPRQGQSVESCIITQWHKRVGDSIKEGDLLFSYETDKASFDEAAKNEGELLAVFFEEDADVPVLSTVAVIGKPGEDYAEHSPAGAAAPEAAKEPVPAAEPAREAAASAPAAAVVAAQALAQGAVSPRARMTAQRLGVDAQQAQGSGPMGRVIERDVYALSQAPAAAAIPAPQAPAAPALQTAEGAAYTDSKLSNLRRVIARTMQESLSSMAQLTHHSSFDASNLLALRARFKAAPAELGLGGITINDLILFAVAKTLLKHPQLNAHLLQDSLRQFSHVQLGIATDSPRGLLVPTLANADTLSIRELSGQAKQLVKAAQGGSINPDLLTGGSFTVTNLGALGIEHFTPIINPPQVAILGVCCPVERPRMVDGRLTTYQAMGLSLTYDHRAVDGAPASRFLQELCRALEQIDVLLL